MLHKLRHIVLFGIISCSSILQAQPAPILPPGFANPGPPLARCVDHARGQTFIVTQSLYAFQENFPANAGMAVRDPSGQMFLRMPAVNPMLDAFFVTWQGQLIQLSVHMPSPMHIGACQFFLPLPPQGQVSLPNYPLAPNGGVITPDGVVPIPNQFMQRSVGISPPASASTKDAAECLEAANDDRDEFMDCMVPKMMTRDQVRAYVCMRRANGDDLTLTSCLAGTLMGENERKAMNQAVACYQENGGDAQKIPLCMASQNFDPQTSRAAACVAKQAQQGSASMWGVAGCAAGAALKLNPELTVAAECAMSSGGQPYVFAACTGGRLTVMELNKCFTVGVGGSGCFGENNEITKGLRALGVDLNKIAGPNGFVLQTWNNAVNDIQHGPGPNNEFNKAVRTINNDLQNGLGPNNDIRGALTKIGLGGLF